MLEYGYRRDVGLFSCMYSKRERGILLCTLFVATLQEDKDSTRDLNSISSMRFGKR